MNLESIFKNEELDRINSAANKRGVTTEEFIRQAVMVMLAQRSPNEKLDKWAAEYKRETGEEISFF